MKPLLLKEACVCQKKADPKDIDKMDKKEFFKELHRKLREEGIQPADPASKHRNAVASADRELIETREPVDYSERFR